MSGISTITERHTEMVRQAIAEVVPIDVRAVRPSPDHPASMSFPSAVARPIRIRALRLVRWRTGGPEYPMVCDRHNHESRPDMWEQCGRVRVVDALRGVWCDRAHEEVA